MEILKNKKKELIFAELIVKIVMLIFTILAIFKVKKLAELMQSVSGDLSYGLDYLVNSMELVNKLPSYMTILKICFVINLALLILGIVKLNRSIPKNIFNIGSLIAYAITFILASPYESAIDLIKKLAALSQSVDFGSILADAQDLYNQAMALQATISEAKTIALVIFALLALVLLAVSIFMLFVENKKYLR